MLRDDEGESGFIFLAADEGEWKENEWPPSCRDYGGGANQKKISVQLQGKKVYSNSVKQKKYRIIICWCMNCVKKKCVQLSFIFTIFLNNKKLTYL